MDLMWTTLGLKLFSENRTTTIIITCCHHRQAHHRNRRHRTSSLPSSFSPWIAWLSFLHDLARFGVTLNCRFPTKQIWPLQLIHSTSTSDHRSISHHQNCAGLGPGNFKPCFFWRDPEASFKISKKHSKTDFIFSFQLSLYMFSLFMLQQMGSKYQLAVWNVCKCWWKG